MEDFNVSEFLSRSSETDSPIEQMVKKAISQVSPDDRRHMSMENGGSSSDQLNSSVIGGNLNGNKSYQDTLLFRQLSQGPTRYHHGTGSGEAPRQHQVHDMNHWKALPNPRSNENGTETVPNSPNGSSSTTTVSTFSDDSNSNSNHGSISKQPQANGYLPGNGGPPNVFDFNINNVKSYSNLPMTPQHNQHDPQNDAEVQYMFCESPYHSPAPTPQQFPKFQNDQNQNYQERQQAYTPLSPYTPQNPHTPQGHDWSNMNQSQSSNGNSGEIISGIINPIFYSTPHVQQQSIPPGGLTNNGFPQNQANTSVIQQQYVNGGAPQQHGIPNSGYQQQAGTTINGMQPQQSVIQQHPMNNGGMQSHIMNNNGTPQQQIQNNGPQQQGSWTNGNGRANHPRYINLDMCNNAAASPAKHGNWYGHQPPSPFLRYDEMKNLTPTTPPYPQMNQQNLQNPQYPHTLSQMPQNLQHVQAQQLNHQGSSKEQSPIWSTPQKKPDTRNSKPTSQRKVQQGMKTPVKDGSKAVIHYRPPPQKRPAPGPMVPVTEIIQNNNARIASIIEEATRTSEVWNIPKDGSRPSRYIIVANPSAGLQFQGSKNALKGQLASPVIRNGGGRGQIRFKVVTPTPPSNIGTTKSGPRVGNPQLETIALDPEKAQKEINSLRLIAKVQRARLMHYAKELEIYRTALAMTNNNPYKMELVKLYKLSQETEPNTKTEPKIPEADEVKLTVPVSPQK